MSDVPVSTRLAAGERSGEIYNSIIPQTDDSSTARFSQDVERVALAFAKRLRHRTEANADMSDVLQHVQITTDSMDPAGDRQILNMYGQDDQTSTRGVRVGDASQAYWTGYVSSTAFMGALVGLTGGMAFKKPHHDIEAITHMGDKEVIDKLSAWGLAGIAERLRYLYDVTGEDEEDIKLDSLRGFAILMIKNRDMHLPQITITDDGLIQAVWRHPRQGTLVMDFQESGDAEFTLLYGRWDQETKRRKLSGELHPDEVMLHVGHFVRDVMGT